MGSVEEPLDLIRLSIGALACVRARAARVLSVRVIEAGRPYLHQTSAFTSNAGATVNCVASCTCVSDLSARAPCRSPLPARS